MKKREALYTVDGNVNWYRHYGIDKTVRRFFKKLKIELPYDPAIQLPGVYPKEIKSVSQRDSFTPMFIAALFTIGMLWKQPKCLATDEWIKNIWYIL